jgi:hypothetical protein
MTPDPWAEIEDWANGSDYFDPSPHSSEGLEWGDALIALLLVLACLTPVGIWVFGVTV